MGHSQAAKAKSHGKILKMAARKIREDGLQKVGVAGLMKDAGLTHGGFYGHFGSRKQLMEEAMELAFVDSMFSSFKSTVNPTNKGLIAFIKNYLGRSHRDTPANGCALAALAGDVRNADTEMREIMTRHIERRFAGLTAAIGGRAAREEAIATMSAMVGAVILSRAVVDKSLSDEILIATRNSLAFRLQE